LFELSGPPAKAKISARATDARAASKLFDVSETLAGVTFPKRAPSSAIAGA
jgi:hypothetical protein